MEEILNRIEEWEIGEYVAVRENLMWYPETITNIIDDNALCHAWNTSTNIEQTNFASPLQKSKIPMIARIYFTNWTI